MLEQQVNSGTSAIDAYVFLSTCPRPSLAASADHSCRCTYFKRLLSFPKCRCARLLCVPSQRCMNSDLWNLHLVINASLATTILPPISRHLFQQTTTGARPPSMWQELEPISEPHSSALSQSERRKWCEACEWAGFSWVRPLARAKLCISPLWTGVRRVCTHINCRRTFHRFCEDIWNVSLMSMLACGQGCWNTWHSGLVLPGVLLDVYGNVLSIIWSA